MTKVSSKKTLAWLLAASLALNLFLGGYVTAKIARRHFDRRPSASRRIPGTDKMSTEGRELVKTRMAEDSEKVRDTVKKLRDERAKLREIMSAETFDRKAAEASMDNIRILTEDIWKEIQDATLDLAEKLSPADRVQLSKGMPGRARGHNPEGGKRKQK